MTKNKGNKLTNLTKGKIKKLLKYKQQTRKLRKRNMKYEINKKKSFRKRNLNLLHKSIKKWIGGQGQPGPYYGGDPPDNPAATAPVDAATAPVDAATAPAPVDAATAPDNPAATAPDNPAATAPVDAATGLAAQNNGEKTDLHVSSVDSDTVSSSETPPVTATATVDAATSVNPAVADGPVENIVATTPVSSASQNNGETTDPPVSSVDSNTVSSSETPPVDAATAPVNTGSDGATPVQENTDTAAAIDELIHQNAVFEAEIVVLKAKIDGLEQQIKENNIKITKIKPVDDIIKQITENPNP